MSRIAIKDLTMEDAGMLFDLTEDELLMITGGGKFWDWVKRAANDVWDWIGDNKNQLAAVASMITIYRGLTD